MDAAAQVGRWLDGLVRASHAAQTETPPAKAPQPPEQPFPPQHVWYPPIVDLTADAARPLPATSRPAVTRVPEPQQQSPQQPLQRSPDASNIAVHIVRGPMGGSTLPVAAQPLRTSASHAEPQQHYQQPPDVHQRVFEQLCTETDACGVAAASEQLSAAHMAKADASEGIPLQLQAMQQTAVAGRAELASGGLAGLQSDRATLEQWVANEVAARVQARVRTDACHSCFSGAQPCLVLLGWNVCA